MAVANKGTGWTVDVEEDVMVWEFLPGMKLSDFQEEAYPVYEDLLERHDFNGMVTVVLLEDPFTRDVFELWEQAALRADKAGIDRWAVVAEGIKSLSLRGKVDVGSLETLTTEDRMEAIQWAKEETDDEDRRSSLF
ncbi:hypothetical protein BRC81_13450 [Halobacteriales archaeon QS_1_68_20]|nr:MAG: hypothetical protein BRC81_13450 [Halobacteriales archaeon QS_1_68_20]